MALRLSRKSKSAASTLFKRVASGQDWDEKDGTRSKARQARNADRKLAEVSCGPKAETPCREAKTKKFLQGVDEDSTPISGKVKQVAMRKGRGRPQNKVVQLASSQTVAKAPTTETSSPKTSEVPVKRRRGRPPKNASKGLGSSVSKEVVSTEVHGSPGRKKPVAVKYSDSPVSQEEALRNTVLVPKVVIVKSPVVTSTVRVSSHGNKIIESGSTSEPKPRGHHGEQTDDVGAPVGTAARSSETAVLGEPLASVIGSEVSEHPRMKKKKYSIMDSQRKANSTSWKEDSCILPKKWQIDQSAPIVEKVAKSTSHNPLHVVAGESAAKSEISVKLVERYPDSRQSTKKRTWKKKVIVPLSETALKSECVEGKNRTEEKQATSDTKKSPKSSQHPSQQLNQDQFCDIFGLIKTSELKKGGRTHKLHREMGGKLRRTIKPRMAPEMVYRKYTIAKGCTIQGLMEEYEESAPPDSQESSPGAASKSRTFHYEERVRRRPGMKGSPPHLMKSSSIEEKEHGTPGQRKLDFDNPMSLALTEKREWLKPPSRKKPKLQEPMAENEIPEPTVPLAGAKVGEKKVSRKGPDMWSQRPWMREHICSTKAKMAIEMKEREAEAPGIRRSARQRESQRKQWWHLLRANPDEYESGDEELLATEEDSDATAARLPADKAVSISAKDMMEVVHWLKKEDAKEKQELKSKEYLAKVHHERMIKAWQTRKARMAATSGFTTTSGPANQKKRKQQKKSVTEDEGGHASIIPDSMKASILEQLRPILSALMKDSSKLAQDNVIELSLPKLFSEPKPLPEERKQEKLGPEAWPLTGFRDKVDECVTPHMCSICWINDHMYCRNMKRVARDLPPSGGCIHYVPCEHYRHLRTSLVYEHSKVPSGLEGTGTCITIQHGKVVVPENRRPPSCGEDLICEESIFESDSDPSAPCSPDGTDLLKLHLKVRELQIKQSLGVSKMPVTPYPLTALEVLEETAVLDDLAFDVKPEDHGAELIIDSEGKAHLPNQNMLALADAAHNYSCGLPPSVVGTGTSTKGHSEGTKVRIRILPLPSDKGAQQSLMKNKEHHVVSVVTNKSGAKEVVMDSLDTSSSGEQKESVIYLKDCMKNFPEDQMGSTSAVTLPDADVLGEIIIQEALRLTVKGKSTPHVLTLTVGQKQCMSDRGQSLEASQSKNEDVNTFVEGQHSHAETDQEAIGKALLDDIPWSVDTVSDSDDASDNSLPDEYKQRNHDLVFTIKQNAAGNKCVSVGNIDTRWCSEVLQRWRSPSEHCLEDRVEANAHLKRDTEKSTMLKGNLNTEKEPPKREVQSIGSGSIDRLSQEEIDQEKTPKDMDTQKATQTSQTKAVDCGTMIQETEATGVNRETVVEEIGARAVNNETVIQKREARAVNSETVKQDIQASDLNTEMVLRATPTGAADGAGKVDDDDTTKAENSDTRMTREMILNASDHGGAVTFTTRDIQECKPELLHYIQESKLAPLIVGKLQSENDALLRLIEDAQYTACIREIREELEQKKCLQAALMSEKEVVVEAIDREEDILQDNDAQTARLRRKKEEVESMLSVCTERHAKAQELLKDIKNMVAIPEIPADQSKIVTTTDAENSDAASQDAFVAPIFVSGVPVEALKDAPLEVEVTTSGKSGSGQQQQQQQKFTIIGPGANVFNPVSSTQAASVTSLGSPALPCPSIPHSGLCLKTSKANKYATEHAGRGRSGATAQTKPAKKEVVHAARGRSQGRGKTKPQTVPSKVRCSKETFPGGLQLLKIRMPGSDKDGYYVKSTSGTLIQVTQVIMSDDKVSQLKLAVNKPLLAADILNEPDYPQSPKKASLLKTSQSTRSSADNLKVSGTSPASLASSTLEMPSTSVLPTSLYCEIPCSTAQNMQSDGVQYLAASTGGAIQPAASCTIAGLHSDKASDAGLACNNSVYTPEALQTLIATLQSNPDHSQTADLSALAEAAAAAALETESRSTEPIVSSPQVGETMIFQTPKASSVAGYHIQAEDGQIFEVQHVDADGLKYAQEGQFLSTSTVEMAQDVPTQSAFILNNSQAVTFQSDDRGGNHEQNNSEAVIYQQDDIQAVTYQQDDCHTLMYEEVDGKTVTSQQDDRQSMPYQQVDQQALAYQQLECQSLANQQVSQQVLTYQQADGQVIVCQDVSYPVQPSQSQQLAQVQQLKTEDMDGFETGCSRGSTTDHVVNLELNQKYQERANENQQVKKAALELCEQVKGDECIKVQSTECALPVEIVQQREYVEHYDPVEVPLGQAEQFEHTQVQPEQIEQYGYVQVLSEQLEQYQPVQVMEQAVSVTQPEHGEQVQQLDQIHGVQHYELSGGTLEVVQHVAGHAVQQSEGSAKVEVQPVVPGLPVTTGMDLLADVINSTLLAENVPHDAV